MNIGVHAHAAFKTKQMGVEHHASEILKAILRLPEGQGHNWNLYTPIVPDHYCDSYLNASARVVSWSLPFGWTRWKLPRELRKENLDVFFSPAHVLPWGVKKGVVVIHGLEFEIIPEKYSAFQKSYLRRSTRTAVKRAAHIIAASKATRCDLINLYKVDTEKITVIHHGALLPKTKPITLPEDIPPFLLTIGRLEHKKNIIALIEAFEILADRGHPHHLVIIGEDGYGAKEIHDRIDISPFYDRITAVGFVKDQTKWAMLERADVFVFPSHYEGFGFPVIEAQYAGTPVVASDVSSLPEVVGNGGLLVQPTPLGLVEAIERILSDSSLRNRLVVNGKSNVGRFSWEKSARETLNILEEIGAS